MTKDEAITLFRANKTAIRNVILSAWADLQDGDSLIDRETHGVV